MRSIGIKKSLRYHLCLLCTSALSIAMNAQQESSQWYFGFKAGLNFQTSPPTVLANSSMSVVEGCSSIADSQGNLLFYSDGETIWDRTHNIMANGTGLLGDNSSTQACLIIKRPGSTATYYIMTLQGMGGNAGLRYSVVDMNLASGNGSVTAKNLGLYSAPCSEKLSATTHCNGTDYRVLCRELGSNNFRAFHVNATGVNPVAVISSVGPVESPFGAGMMKLSINGKKGGMINVNARYVALFDFDNSNGQVSNVNVLDTAFYGYGCEFSPDGSKFYCTGWDSISALTGDLRQYDFCSQTSTTVAQTLQVFTTSVNPLALQLAPDGKIYVAAPNSPSLGVINSPDGAGPLCNFAQSAITLSPNLSASGLPNMITSLYSFPQPFTYTSSAAPSCNSFSFTAAYDASVYCTQTGNSAVSYSWNFGDAASGSAASSTLKNPVHQFMAAGVYSVTLQVNLACRKEISVQTLTVSTPLPAFAINAPSVMCVNKTYTLSVTNPTLQYTWSGHGQMNSVVTTPTVAGPLHYTITATDTVSMCTFSRTYTLPVAQCSGIGDAESTRCSLFPSPASDFVQLRCSESNTWEVKLEDLKGVFVKGFNLNERETIHVLDIRDLRPGLYLLRFGAYHRKLVVLR